MEEYSVLMSVYYKDSPDYLRESIESMLTQTVLCNQFVLIKDGPLNSQLDLVICEFEKKYPSIFTVVSLSRNVGLGRALDRGILECKNELIARMDADDISLPNRCEKLLALFEENPQLSIAGTNIDEFYDSPDTIISSRVVPCSYDEICRFMKRRSPFNHPTVMFKKSDVIKCGGYGTMRRKQDLDLFARMINNNCYALNINESLLKFRSSEDNYKRRKSWEYCRSYIEVEAENYRRGYCSIVDLLVVSVGQLFLFCAPKFVMKFVSDRLLRKRKMFSAHRSGKK